MVVDVGSLWNLLDESSRSLLFLNKVGKSEGKGLLCYHH